MKDCLNCNGTGKAPVEGDGIYPCSCISDLTVTFTDEDLSAVFADLSHLSDKEIDEIIDTAIKEDPWEWKD